MRLREVINNLQEEAWTSHKELANLLYKHTGNKQLAIDFYHLETEFDSQDDMQSTGLSALDIDPFESDRERVNRILSINKVPVKVLKMKHNDAYETLYSLLQSAPVSEAPAGSPGYGQEGKPEWYDRAVQMKLNNPHITATEIAKQIGISSDPVVYWLTGKDTSRPHMARPKGSFPFEPDDFPVGSGKMKYYDGAKPEWYDQALQMAKAGESFVAIAKKFGVTAVTVGLWLIKGRKNSRTGKIINPDAELEPRKIRGKKLDVNLLMDFISTGYTDKDIIELIVDEKGPKIASQVKNMLPQLRQKLNPGTQVIDKTATGINNPDISSVKV